jgi:excisionase family DNA binding protein
MPKNEQLAIRDYFPADDVIPVNLSIEYAGKLIGISRPSVYPLIAAGDLESVRIKGRHLITTRSVVAYLGRVSS